MPIQHFDNLGAIGIVEDLVDNELPHNAWTDGQNVRFNNQVVEKMTGHSTVYGTPADIPYFAIPVQVGGSYFWHYSSLTDNYITDGSTHGCISVDGLTGTGNASLDINWTGGALGGGVLVLNNGVDAPIQWTGTSLTDQFEALSNWPAGMKARTLRPFKQVLVAGDIDEGSGRNGTLLRWSHPAAPGAVPASWDYTDDAYDAGRTTLTQGGDYIVDMETLRDIMMIYKEDSTWTMQFVGGRAQYAFRKAFDQLGGLSRRCMKEFFGQHVVLATDDIIMHDGNRVTQFLNKRWKRWLFNNIDPTYSKRSFITVNHNRNEIWICFPSNGYSLPNTALIWNWSENTTSVRQLPTGTAHIARGIVDDSISAAIEDQSGLMSDQTGIFDEQSYSNAKRYLLMCDANRTLFYKADDTEQFNGTSFTAYVERSGLPLGRVDDRGQMRKVDLTSIKYITEIWPVIEGTIGGAVDIYIGVRDYPGDTVSWKGPYTYTIGSNEKLNVRAAGRIVDIKFTSNTNITWKLSSYALNYQIRGER